MRLVGQLVGQGRKPKENGRIIGFLTGKAFDTVGVWGSNPHAPTNPFNKLHPTTSFSVAPKRST